MALLVALGAPACATILDFQDPVDLPSDAGTATFGGDASLASETATEHADRTVIPSPEAGDARGCTCPAIPPGWRGPLRLEETAGTPAECGGDFPSLDYDGHAGPQGEPASCTCSCGAPTAMTCGQPTAQAYSDLACGASCGASTAAAGCTRLSCAGTIGSVRVTAPAVGGSCASSSQSSAIAPPRWERKVRVCSGSTCGRDCSANVCVAMDGAAACPAGFPSLHMAYGSMEDTRACSPCGCDAPAGATCAGAVSSYTSGSCSAAVATDPFNACVSSTGRLSATVTGTPTGGACAPNGGAPTGTVRGLSPVTICCQR